MSTKRTFFFRQGCGRQHGAALMVMLVILVVGVAAILVSVLSSSSLNIERDKTTADALAKAKNALIGRAVADTTSPGSLPCPDTNDDGSAEIFSGSDCPSYIGKLPWKTLGLPDLRDGSGERLWYALSPNFRDKISVAPINSDTVGSLNVSGSVPANNVIAIVFAAGNPLSGQNRTSASSLCTTTNTTIAANLCATNYLEGNNAQQSTATSPATLPYQTAAGSSSFNDQAIYITHNDLFPQLEWRIAREAKQCLDNYAAGNTNNRYPWAAPDNDTTNYSGTYDTLFGRIATTPYTQAKSVDSTYALPMLNALRDLQTALNNYSANINSTTTSALLNAGQTLITASQNAANYSSSSFYSYSSITTNADTAGDQGRDLANGVSGVTVSTAQGYIDNTNSNLKSYGFYDNTMSLSWPSGCVFDSSSYWNNWRQEVFYQVASGNSPGTSVTGCVNSCLSISGSGNPNPGSGTYTAAVIVGRAHSTTLNSGTPTSNPPVYYLEGINQNDGTSGSCSSPPFPGGKHDSTKNYSTCPMLSQKFVTYRPTDPSYSSVNDPVVCLDGKYNCK